MKNRYYGRVEISGFWIFIILLFIFVPLVERIIDRVEPPPTEEVTPTPTEPNKPSDIKIVSIPRVHGVQEVTFNVDMGNAPRDKQVRFKVNDEAVRVTIVSPDKEKVSTDIKRGYVYFVFNKTGSWEIETYNADGFTTDWLRIEVY